jgi:hypothetical protein
MNLKQLINIACLAAVLIAFSCASKKEEAGEATAAGEKEWKEMDEFHMVMAEAFHPYKDSANLEPAKLKAGELVSSAEKWAGATLPEKVDNDEMKGKLEELKNESASFVQTVSAGDDKAIGDQLTKLHDLFHTIQEEWYGGDDHGHEHH